MLSNTYISIGGRGCISASGSAARIDSPSTLSTCGQSHLVSSKQQRHLRKHGLNALLCHKMEALFGRRKDLASPFGGGQKGQRLMGHVRPCLQAKLPSVVIELPYLARIRGKGLRRGQLHGIMRAPQPACATKGGYSTGCAQSCWRRGWQHRSSKFSPTPSHSRIAPSPPTCTRQGDWGTGGLQRLAKGSQMGHVVVMRLC